MLDITSYYYPEFDEFSDLSRNLCLPFRRLSPRWNLVGQNFPLLHTDLERHGLYPSRFFAHSACEGSALTSADVKYALVKWRISGDHSSESFVRDLLLRFVNRQFRERSFSLERVFLSRIFRGAKRRLFRVDGVTVCLMQSTGLGGSIMKVVPQLPQRAFANE
jgi:hypothetical protein